MIVNYSLLFFATTSLYFGIEFYLYRKREDKLCVYIILLAISSALWNYGYAFMGLTPNLAMAPVYRKIALLGASGFMSTEALMFAYKANIPYKKRRSMAIALIFLVAGDVFIWGADNVRKFYRVGNRTLYVSGESNGYYYQPLYIVFMACLLVFLFLKWRKNTVFERDKHFQALLLATNIFIAIGTIPDTILPILGMESFPSSPIGGYATLLAMLNVCNKYIQYDIFRDNLAKHIYESGDVGILVFNLSGRLDNCNQYATSTLNIAGIKGQKLSDIFEMGELCDDDIFSEVLKNTTLQKQLNGKNSDKNYSLNFSVIRDFNDDPYCIILAIYDRSNEQKLIEEIRRSSEIKSSFLANMSHEIRNPINSILGMGEMILKESANPKVTDFATSMEKSGNQLLKTVNNILDYSRIQSGMLKLVITDYDFARMIHRLVIKYRQLAFKKGLEFRVNVDPDIPEYVTGDELRLSQAVENILDNAVKYTECGHISFSVTGHECDENETELAFVIEDTGIGIKNKDKNELFGAFERADLDMNRTIAGTGLGLAIVGSLVNMMDGEVSGKSEYGEGSSFTIRLKQRSVSGHRIGDYEKSLAAYEEAHRQGWDFSFVAPSAKILVVDDDRINLNVAQYLLEHTKITVDTAQSGEEAVSMVKKESYDLVFLDHIMPGMDGVETLNAIREQNLSENVPVICLSANDISGAREMYAGYGFNDFLPKPISGGSFERKVYEWLPKDLIQETKDDKLAETEILPKIEGINWATARSFLPSKKIIINTVTELYKAGYDNAEQLRILYIEGVINKSDSVLNEFKIKIHAIKSNLKMIGASVLSERAKELERAASEADRSYIIENIERFLNEYVELLNAVGKIPEIAGLKDIIKRSFDKEIISNRLDSLIKCMEDFDPEGADKIVTELESYDYPENISADIRDISSMVLKLDLDGVRNKADEVKRAMGE